MVDRPSASVTISSLRSSDLRVLYPDLQSFIDKNPDYRTISLVAGAALRGTLRSELGDIVTGYNIPFWPTRSPKLTTRQFLNLVFTDAAILRSRAVELEAASRVAVLLEAVELEIRKLRAEHS